MNVVKCTNGHFFDGDTYTQCPHCGAGQMNVTTPSQAKEEKKGFWSRKKETSRVEPIAPRTDCTSSNPQIEDTPTMPLEQPATDFDRSSSQEHTLDFWQTPSGTKNTDDGLKEAPASESVIESPVVVAQQQSESEKVSLKDAVQRASASSEGKTMSYFSTAASGSATTTQRVSEPVVGWLVCVKGPHLGESFSIYAGKNSIGRNEENKIILNLDNSVSRSKHALIIYEPKKRNFYLQPGDGSGLTYLNDEYITESHKLTLRDFIEIGECQFMFVPLCGEEFSWETYLSKENA